ncbi:MAG: DUF3821 domain-containing protein [Methanoregula sp.]|nr:DUF3821 domain-containing protein [Methanoregula sp.]
MNMMSKNAISCFLLILGVIFLINPVFAAINTIRPGDTVFIGEQGLDVTLALEGDTQIGWWASAASIADSSPTGLVSVSNPASFSISQSPFGYQTGVWYHLNPSGKANGTAFNVADPQLDIIVEDTTVNVDVTNKWVPTDDELRFRIDSNLVPISGRTGQSFTPITIKVQSPDGALFSALISKSGVTTSIVDYPVTTTPQYVSPTGPIWGTSNRATYPPGTYTIWAECNVNSMKDNYGVVGKTISRKVSVLNQDQNPLIGNKGYVTNPTTLATLVPSIKKTSIATTALTTLKTPPPTSAVPTEVPMTTEVTVIPTTSFPTPAQTKSPGFAASLAVAAMILGLAFFVKKE